MDGINKAKKAGISFGRRKSLSTEQIIELKAKRRSNVLIRELMSEYGISEASVYRYLNSLQSPTNLKVSQLQIHGEYSDDNGLTTL